MSASPPRPDLRPNKSKFSTNAQKAGQSVVADLTPQDLKKYLSQPVRSIFHEQAKSIVAIQVREVLWSICGIVPLRVTFTKVRYDFQFVLSKQHIYVQWKVSFLTVAQI